MATKLRRVGMRTLAGALVATGPVVAACSTGPTYEQWAETDGASGRINLDEVQAAFKKSKSPTDFERRVNEIYEGDGLVLIRSKQDGNALVLEGWEDLGSPANNEIDDATDDLLFTIMKKEDKSHEMRGYGANGYYNRGFGAGDFLFTYLLISAISPRGYYYNTPRTRARGQMTRQRTTYRNTSRYRSQVSKNSRYFSKQKSFQSSRYSQAGRSQSTARKSYQSRQQTTGKFKTSGTGVRSSWGASSRGGRGGFRGGRGGFRGGGGGQVIVGATRPRFDGQETE